MGLEVSHGCYNGTYSGFDRFRRALARSIGIDLDAMEGFKRDGNGMAWEALKPDPLLILLNHSDSDGEIAVADCQPLAARLRDLAETVLHDDDGTRFAALLFAAGLDRAVAAGQDVEFW